MTPEFSRTVRTDTLGAEPRQLTIEANEQERTALARRFGLPAIAALTADAELNRNGETVVAVGTLRAEVTQSCVATALPVAAAVEEPFRILFRPQPAAGGIDEEVELGEADLDVVFYSSASVDIGEAIAETLALSLDPYPRAPGAEEVLKQAGVLGECEAGPFGALAGLKDKLAGG